MNYYNKMAHETMCTSYLCEVKLQMMFAIGKNLFVITNKVRLCTCNPPNATLCVSHLMESEVM